MLLHSVIEEQHHISRTRVQPTGNDPGTKLVWALEVEKNHTDRLISLIRCVCQSSDLIATVPESLSGFSSTKRADSLTVGEAAKKTHHAYPAKGGSSLIFSSINLVNETVLPMEAFRSVRRMFFVPHSCHDPICIVSHHDFTSLFSRSAVLPNGWKTDERKLDVDATRSSCNYLNTIAILKVQTSPKELGKYLEDMIRANQNEQHNQLILFENGPLLDGGTANAIPGVSDIIKNDCWSNIQTNNGHTHLLQCIYGAHDGIFRWGVVSKEKSVDFKLTAESIEYGIHSERQNRFERDGLSHPKRRNTVEVPTSNFIPIYDKYTPNMIETLGDEIRSIQILPNLKKNQKELTQSLKQSSTMISHTLPCDSEQSLSLQEGNSQRKSIDSIDHHKNKLHSQEFFTPASRAYYKMSEIKEFYFPLWNWTWPGEQEVEEDGKKEKEMELFEGRERNDTGIHGREKNVEYSKEDKSEKGRRGKSSSRIKCCAIDVGSSPGGWTQCLAAHCAYVLSVDPGIK